MLNKSNEERGHAYRMIAFLVDSDQQVELPTVDAPERSWPSVKDLFDVVAGMYPWLCYITSHSLQFGIWAAFCRVSGLNALPFVAVRPFNGFGGFLFSNYVMHNCISICT